MPIGGALVKGMIGGALKERAKNIGKTKAGKLLAREGRVMMGKPQPRGQVGGAPTVQPQQTLAPAAPTTGGGGGSKSFKSDKEAALSIKTSTIQVATLLKGSYVLEKEQLKNKRQAEEQAKRGKAEKDLEKGPKGGGGKFKMPKLPGKGLLDKIFGFVSAIVFGWLALKLVDWMPTLQRILPTLGRVADWFISAGIWVVDALAGIIDFGYKLVDKMEGWVKNVFGEEGAEKFKTFMTNLKDLIAGFLVWKIIGKKIFESVVKNIKFAFNIAKSIVVNAFRLVNFITGGLAKKGLTAVTKGLTKVGTSIAKRTGLTAAKKMGGKIFKHGAKRGAKRALLKMFGKQFVKRAGSIFGRVPIVGPLIVGLVSLVSGENIGQALFKTFGAALGGFLGGIAGTAITAALAVGTAGVGGFLAGLILPASVMIGEILGTFVGDMLYNLIFGGGLGAVGEQLKKAFMAIGSKIMEGVTWLSELPIVSQLLTMLQEGGNLIWNFGKWVFFDSIPWVMDKLGGAAKLLKEWFDAGMKRFVDDFPVFNLPLMKGKILWTIPYDINWILGKMFGGIPWFQQWINGEGQLMHFPDFSMFAPVLGLPFLMGHVGKSLFPGSFFKSWPSGISSLTNFVGASIHEKLQENQHNPGAALSGDKDSKSKDKDKESLRKDALKNKNERQVTARFDMETGTPYINEKAVSAEEYNKFINLSEKEQLVQYGKPTNFETKLKTANKQGGAKAVIKSISTTASYEDGSPEVITLPAPTSTTPDTTSSSSKSGSPLVTSEGGNNDPYEALYKGG